MRKRSKLLGVISLAFVLGACTGGGVDELPAPPTTGATTSTTARPDLSATPLGGVSGTTTTTVALGPGEATLQGIVRTAEGLVPEATVLVERLVGSGVASMAVATGPDGKWMVPTVFGGRYRVRAWRSPDLALTDPEIFFLEAKETKDLSLEMKNQSGIAVTAAVAPSPPPVGETVRLAVRIFTRSVDESGFVRNQGLSNLEAQLTGSSTWQVESTNPTTADSNGEAQWLVRCTRGGRHALAVIIAGGEDSFPLNLPDCGTPPPAEPEEDIPEEDVPDEDNPGSEDE